MTTSNTADRAMMAAALALARRGLGQVAPNPAVGCVLAREGRVVGRGWTQPGGRPHAETEALARAGEASRGATAYVTLEPCSHHGGTAPCAEALIAAGIGRCVVAMTDPDSRVSGAGIEMLQAAGIAVEIGLLGEEAAALNAGYLLHRNESRPLVALKLATSLDGRIATAKGESRWITGEAARAEAHGLRARFDAVMVGSGTALADDPRLDCRLPGLEALSPIRVIADARLRLPLEHSLVRDARALATILITSGKRRPEELGPYEQAGLRVLPLLEEYGENGLDPRVMLRALADEGITRLLIEGGGQLAASFCEAGLVDEVYWFHAPMVLGADGRPAVEALALDSLSDAPRFSRVACRTIGEDILETYVRSH